MTLEEYTDRELAAFTAANPDKDTSWELHEIFERWKMTRYMDLDFVGFPVERVAD